MSSLAPAYLGHLSYSATDVSALRRLGEHRGKQELFARQRPEVLEALRTVAVVESSESSNRLEGIVAPKERVEALVIQRTSPRNRSEQEIAGYRDALELIHQSATEMTLSTNVIQQLHQTIYRYLPQEGGRWKMIDNEIIERAANGTVLRVRFSPVTAVATPHAMEDLVEHYRRAVAAAAQDPLVLVPLVVLDFLCIHPFSDGNGRIARLLTLMLLYHSGYEVGRYISLERIFEQSRETYYETLEASSSGWHTASHDVGPWLRYFWGVLLRAYDEFEQRVGTIGGGKGSKAVQVRAAVTRKVVPFRITEIERECPGISRETIRLVLRQMRDEGLIAAEGAGRGTRWRPRDAG